ncbi:MAG: DUF1343 domain-containing protein [Bacteroidetes bacterium]|nr:MAG: DUF1343 domain-containing protein [Bacteroidota bacterium]MBL1146017.1 DUF1343 domain-containing protein [Bacteroidota bacterium]MCB0802211.1 DUF1343 domain-containing protein [Flavobacteriales bacterium]NOG58811.1 DUF1343 domain-containing protein [Bacteroidota bacterium]
MPNVIATIEIRIIGLEKEFSFPLTIFFAINSSKFKNGTPLVRNKSMKLNIDFPSQFVIKALIFCLMLFGLDSAELKAQISTENQNNIILGNQRIDEYIDDLKGKKVALVANHTSLINQTHLLDTLLSLKINVIQIFSPEHGFRGNADAGEKVNNQIDKVTGLPIVSLYGNNKKPSPEQVQGIEVLIFDIQDVGARFYTYISTLHYVMEAAAENNIQLIVLDRPNPNGHYVDGPILEEKFKSFVGMHPIPVVHGMTIGEYAKMINGESWLKGGVQCNLKIVTCLNYNHSTEYRLPISPSPNLPNLSAIYNYPSICFFEGTPISVGRGTDKPFQQIGYPDFKNYSYVFIPKPSFGAKNPRLNGKKCYGINLQKEVKRSELNLQYLIDFYKLFKDKDKFFDNFFNLLAGNSTLQNQIKAGKNENQIRASWQPDLTAFKLKRKDYLLYPDFE